MALPDTLKFHGISRRVGSQCFYEVLGFRPPKQGEYYVSGAIPAAYKAPNDLPTAYQIVRPTHLAARRPEGWVRSYPINYEGLS